MMSSMATAEPSVLRRASGLFVPGIDAQAEAQRIMDQIGDMADAVIFGNRILVAKWIRTTMGSLLAAEQTRREDKWQGKVGLVLAVGPLAFKDDPSIGTFAGQSVKVGDWALFQYSDGRDLDFQPPGSHEKIPCKILRDVDIDGVVPRPDMFF